jgi:hypothetical protein
MPTPIPPRDIPKAKPEPEPKPYSTYFEYERQRILGPGEDKIGSDIPPLPPESPWAAENQPEPTIDRSDDGDTMGVEIDLLNR